MVTLSHTTDGNHRVSPFNCHTIFILLNKTERWLLVGGAGVMLSVLTQKLRESGTIFTLNPTYFVDDQRGTRRSSRSDGFGNYLVNF